MNIVKQKWDFLKKTEEYVSPQISKLYSFGLQALVGRSVVSQRSNARILPLKWNTAKSKIYRLTANIKIPLIFIKLVRALSLIGEKDIVAVDFSDFGNGFQVLMFAKQTKRGRALPLYFEILRYPIEKGSQNIFIIQAIKNFTETVGCRPTLVFDRGFAIPYMIKYVAQNKHKFIIRIKKSKSAHDCRTGVVVLAKDVLTTDTCVLMYGLKLRLIISDQLSTMREPWYLITNDMTSSRKKTIEHYYHRFEIEEFFRDAKRLLNLEHVRHEKHISLSVLLWFTILGIWFFASLEEKMDANIIKEKVAWQVSTIRYWFEKLQHEYIISTEASYLTFKCG